LLLGQPRWFFFFLFAGKTTLNLLSCSSLDTEINSWLTYSMFQSKNKFKLSMGCWSILINWFKINGAYEPLAKLFIQFTCRAINGYCFASISHEFWVAVNEFRKNDHEFNR
jgi:hypothetical protein